MSFPRFNKPDYVLAIVIFSIMVFGLIMISSSSVVESYQISDGQKGNIFIINHLITIGISLFFWILFQNIDYHYFEKRGIYFLLGTLLLLALPFIPYLGREYGGAHRWVYFFGQGFQPSEFAKITFIIYLASWFAKRQLYIGSFIKGFLPFIFVLGLVFCLLAAQPDIGTAAVFALVALTMFFVAGSNIWHLVTLVPIIGLAAIILVKSAPYRMARILTFINPKADIYGISYHINQAIIAIGSGGLLGVGFGNSLQKYQYLPEASTDSIMAVIGEELGFVRAVLVILAFAFVAYRGFQIARSAKDNFGRYLATGIVAWITFQAFINIAGMLGLMPFTGVTLPFVSYGGTSLLVLSVAVGILLNISKQRESQSG